MKKLFVFLRSMKFGLILLIAVMVCSLAGSLIPQGREANIFSSWYFILLVGMLFVNVSLCCASRLPALRKIKGNVFAAADSGQDGHVIGAAAAAGLKSYLAEKKYRSFETENSTVFYKNLFGYYGSFVVHVSVLLILVFGGLVLGLSQSEDYYALPGREVALENGAVLMLESFRITDQTGKTDYASIINITTPDGKSSGPREIRVNYPLTYRGSKYYQQSYGTAGSLSAVNQSTKGSDVFYLTERSFFSADGRNGIWFEALFPGYTEDEDGNITPLVFRTNVYPDPIYLAMVADGGVTETRFFLPGETIQAGDIVFEFNMPINYPGIRVKSVPDPFPALLYAAFALMTAGFWLNFFHMPSVVSVREDSYTITGSAGVQLKIDIFLQNQELTDEENRI